MIDISWHQLKTNSTSEELSFESFCNQIARKKYGSYGKIEEYYNTAGSEFYLELNKDCDELFLKKGDIIGWQAKFWLNAKDENNSPLDTKHRDELIDGFNKTLEYKSDLKYWIICTPGKFLNTKPTCPWDSLCDSLKQIKPDIKLEHWYKETFESIFHFDSEGYSSVFNHYFNSKFIGIKLINDFTNRNLKELENKFDVDLYVPDEREVTLISAISIDKGKLELKKTLEYLLHKSKKIKEDGRIEEKIFHDLPIDYTQLAKSYLNKYISLIDRVLDVDIDLNDTIISALTIYDMILEFQEHTASERIILNKKISEIFTEDNESKIHFQDIDWHDMLINYVIELKDKIFNKEDNFALINCCKRFLIREYHVFGSAANGKTNFVCSIAYNQIKQELPVLLLLGSSFKNQVTPKERILQLLELSGIYSFMDFLGALNNLALLKRARIPIIIDGLNESSPTSGAVWNQEIYSIINDVKKFSNLILITTCREKNEYIQQIFGKSFYTDIENYIYLKGFTEKNIDRAIKKYFSKKDITVKSDVFDKNLFYNPLRLKIFSEVNAGKHDIEISTHSLVNGIDKYLDKISDKISISNNSIDRIVENRLRKGFKIVGDLLWVKNQRDLKTFEEFMPIFDNGNVTWCESLTFKIIDEGLCFQRNIEDMNEVIQFSIDLIAGYQIAKSTFFSELSEEKIIRKLKEQNSKNKLYHQDDSIRHPMCEDILIAISYLLPQRTSKQLFDIFPINATIIESIGNLDLIAFNQEEKQKLISFINRTELNINLKTQILHILYNDIIYKNIFTSFDIIEDIFLSLNQYEIDSNWCELIRKDSPKLQKLLWDILKNLNVYKDCEYNVFLFITLLTASTDKKLRNEATKALMNLGLTHPKILLELSYKLKLVKDGFILESLICSLSGIVLRLKNKEITTAVIKFFDEDFLVTNLTNHASILDYIQTVFDFGLTVFDIKCDNSILFRNQDEHWNYNKEKTKDVKNKNFWSYEMMDYDFIKYQVTSLSDSSYDRTSKYTKAEIVMLISEKIKEKGYGTDKYSVLESKINEDNKYRREEVSEQVIRYSEKYLNITYQELAGFLMLNLYIRPEFENTFRFKYVFFDPTFPIISGKKQLINDCFLPAYNEDIQEWINEDSTKLLEEHYLTIPVFESSEMVLLRASLTQENKDNDTRITIYISSFVFNKAIKKRIIKIFNASFYDQDEEKYQIFAGEIPWRKHILSEQQEFGTDDTFTPDYYPLVTEYSWSSWTSDRFQNPHFAFLNMKIANEMELDFDVEHLSYIDKGGKVVTKYYKTENSEFLYIDREILEKYLNEKKLDLIWNKFIAKYGEFGIDNEKKLNPSYKDCNNHTLYSEIKDVTSS